MDRNAASPGSQRRLLARETPTWQPYYCGVGAPDTSRGGGESRSTKYLMFGHSMTESFECDLSLLLGKETFFYDPYIVDRVSGSWVAPREIA